MLTSSDEFSEVVLLFLMMVLNESGVNLSLFHSRIKVLSKSRSISVPRSRRIYISKNP